MAKRRREDDSDDSDRPERKRSHIAKSTLPVVTTDVDPSAPIFSLVDDCWHVIAESWLTSIDYMHLIHTCWAIRRSVFSLERMMQLVMEDAKAKRISDWAFERFLSSEVDIPMSFNWRGEDAATFQAALAQTSIAERVRPLFHNFDETSMMTYDAYKARLRLHPPWRLENGLNHICLAGTRPFMLRTPRIRLFVHSRGRPCRTLALWSILLSAFRVITL
jgi:hypothetical protein